MSTTPTRLDPRLLPSHQLEAARNLMVRALLARGFPDYDVQDAVQDVLARIVANPGAFAHHLAALDDNTGFFVAAAYWAYFMQLRKEQARRHREERHHRLSVGDGEPSDLTNDLLELAAAAPLTAQQKTYLSYVFDEHLSVEEIAARTATTPRAVRAVLHRASLTLRAHVHRPSA